VAEARATTPPEPRQPNLPLIRREIRLLVVLSIVAAALFGATRALAQWTHDVHARVAAGWFDRGMAAAARSDPDAAIAALRRAAAANPAEPAYVLALARLLALHDGRDEARRLLLRLREDQPDSVEVNYWLARTAAADGEIADAVRYYNHAMYGLVEGGAPHDRPGLRRELIGVLLEGGESEGARAEIVALARELPEGPDARVELATLAERAGDLHLAHAHYAAAARLDDSRAAAFAGAGRTALALWNLAAAERFLTRAVRMDASDDRSRDTLAVVRRALTADPLQPRLSERERARRATAALAWAAARLEACAARPPQEPAPPAPTPLSVLRAEVERRRRQRASTAIADIEATLALIGRVLDGLAGCPADDPLLEAWRLVLKAHAESAQ
jgi:tetratricopeptide (TPR) repeat protein